jgi:hypothetical protein
MNTDLFIEPSLLRELAEQHWNQWDVMKYQLQYDDDLTDEHLDAVVNELAQPIIRAIDCTKCGNCCRVLWVDVEEADASRLAEGLHVRLDDISTHYITHPVEGDPLTWGRIRSRPCPFLTGTRCGVYEHRPQTCRDYPFLTPDFRWTLDDLMSGAGICPIIYHTLCAVEQRVDDITAGRL